MSTPSIDLGALCRAAGLRPPENQSAGQVVISGICHDSRRVSTGDLYVAIAGERFDGRAFVDDAVGRGAAAVLGPLPQDSSDLPAVPWVEVEDPRPLLGPLSVKLFGAPHQHMTLVGVTGTNGKSTFVRLMASVLEAAGQPAAILGTLGYEFAGHAWQAGGRTTPEAPDLHRMLAGMTEVGARSAAMEVSSIALDMGRLDGTRFDAMAFTNLSHDHLDYHGDMETYFHAKRGAFDLLKSSGRAVVNVADAWGRRLAELLPEAVTFAGSVQESDATGAPSSEAPAQVYAVESQLDLTGIQASIATPRGTLELSSPLLGRYNLANLLTCVATAEALGIDAEDTVRGLESVGPIAGRLERVRAEDCPYPALVDYAHTPDALDAALRSVRELTERRLLVVFGCGGERDREKRPMMGRIARRHADLAILTSDNPRREDPAEILRQVEAGLTSPAGDGTRGGSYEVEADRRAAIYRAIAIATQAEEAVDKDLHPGWVVVVAGKGHETTQDLGSHTLPFDDRQVLAEAIDAALCPAPERTHG